LIIEGDGRYKMMRKQQALQPKNYSSGSGSGSSLITRSSPILLMGLASLVILLANVRGSYLRIKVLSDLAAKVLTNGELYSKKANCTKRFVETKRRVYVCITGQVERLLLPIKISSVLEPLQQAGYEIDIALMLTEGTSYFSNVHMTSKPEWASWLNAARYLRQEGYNVINDAPITTDPSPSVPAKYVEQLDRKLTLDRQRKRAQNHARQFESLTYCNDAINKEYDFIIRLREDVGLEPPLNVSGVESILYEDLHHNKTKSKIIMTSDCRSWAGMNDRMAIVTPDIAEGFFNGPFQSFDFLAQKEEKGNASNGNNIVNKTPSSLLLSSLDGVSNTETFIYTTYTALFDARVIQTPVLERIVKYTTDFNGTVVKAHSEDELWKCSVGGAVYKSFLEEKRRRRQKKRSEERKRRERAKELGIVEQGQ
jgi:hypothetical protein